MIVSWLKTLLSGKPHQMIGGEDDPYMLRWHLVRLKKLPRVYLHKFLRDDDDRAMHDHPWWFFSFMVYGSYNEVLPGNIIKRRSAPSICFRNASHIHRVALDRDASGKPVPCWTIVVTGTKVRSWGFWCPKGFIPWRKFDAQGGCGDD
jgi:hypothetical protein